MLTRREAIQSAIAGALLPLAAAPLRGAAPQARAASLGAIRAVTITAGDLKAVEHAWTRFMGYKVISRGRLGRATAESWDAPGLSGKSFVILGPESGETTYLRFVEQPLPADAGEERALGWRATEITVQNSDELYKRLQHSPFTVRAPPAQVPTYSYLHAMQAVGPAGERLNLTWITEPRPDLAVARSFVGRCFIAVLGAPDLPQALEFFRSRFGNAPSPIRQLGSLQLAVVPLQDGTKIEVDQLGPQARPRPRPARGLPPGLAIVTFECSRLETLHDRFIGRPAVSAIEPHRGRHTVTVHGSAGELIELVET
jgi:catechol 2,3-dioxygenase-like lactoylglutathione lyase family enzyme